MNHREYMNYDKFPKVNVGVSKDIVIGWKNIFSSLMRDLEGQGILAIDCYHGVFEDDIEKAIIEYVSPERIIKTSHYFKSESKIKEMIQSDVTDNRIFGYMTRMHLIDFFDYDKLDQEISRIKKTQEFTVVLGIGAKLLAPHADITVYMDMSRWEIQQRQRQNEINNIGLQNKDMEPLQTYKHSFFVDWRVLDRYKKSTWTSWDYVVDTNISSAPKMIRAQHMFDGLENIITRPFRVVPFFDPGVWGGQWMKDVCGLDPSSPNYAWCFDCVPEENSLYLGFDNEIFEIPAINVVFAQARKLLGDPVHARFGDEFPIRFDFLDTMGGQHLSFQVHPTTEYIQEYFGMHYTQDESYYILDAEDDAVVYLGLKNGVKVDELVEKLQEAQKTGEFHDEKYVERFSAKKHDHFLIPAGTVHCSGKNSMVLEISATPYIFTFKLWDWGRLGMDGKPRPINIEHGKRNIIPERNSSWVKEHLVNACKKVGEGDGWIEEKTGLHEREFIETRRHRFNKKVLHNTGGIHGSVHVLNLVEGEEVIIEHPHNKFHPFIVHYAETFIVPANVGEYTISPHGISEGKMCITMKAFVRY